MINLKIGSKKGVFCLGTFFLKRTEIYYSVRLCHMTHHMSGVRKRTKRTAQPIVRAPSLSTASANARVDSL